MSETEPHSIIELPPIKPEPVLSAREAEIMQRVAAGELSCPHCWEPLGGSEIVMEEYQGIQLFCLGCGFYEYG